MHREIALVIVALGAIGLCEPSLAAPDQATQDRCSHYAQRAVQQYQLMSSNPSCHVKNDLRWQDNVDNHYNGCLAVPEFIRKSEESARDNHLKACGGWAEDTTANSAAAPAPQPAVDSANSGSGDRSAPSAPPAPQVQSASSPPETKTIAIGQTRDQVIATFGVPTKIVQLGKKEIDYYPDMKVTFIQSKVADVN
jgi:hypothetical protein